MMSQEDLILATAQEIARSAATTAMGYFRNNPEIELKADESPVTVADLHIEKDARAVLTRVFPGHSILGEEYGAGDLSNNDVWVIDPIDGTRSFLAGHPLFGFLLAYLKDAENRLSIVGMPALNEVFLSQSGQGASLNGKPIKVSAKMELSEAILFINEGEKIFAMEPEVHARLVVSGHTRRFAYDCYPHALLAAGLVDVVVDYDLKPFDYLPLTGLVEEAGGLMTDWAGQPLDFASDGRVVSAATPELHQQMLRLLSA
jgi:histidinol phosphatase-like enzyme (inositol monophosphatase family)